MDEDSIVNSDDDVTENTNHVTPWPISLDGLSYGQRVAGTIGCLLLFVVGLNCPVPGIDFESLLIIYDGHIPQSLRHDFSIFSLGLISFLMGTAFATLMTRFSKKSSERMESSVSWHFDAVILLDTFIAALGMSSLNLWKEATILGAVGDTVPTIQFILLQAAGALLVGLLATLITRLALINGVVAMVLVAVWGSTVDHIWRFCRDADPRVNVDATLIGLAVFTIALAALSYTFVCAHRQIPLRRLDDTPPPDDGHVTPQLRLRVNMTGVLPILLSSFFLSKLQLLVILGVGAESDFDLPYLLSPFSVLYWVLFLFMTAFFVLFLTPAFFSSHKLITTVKQCGFEIAGTSDDRQAEEYIDDVAGHLFWPGLGTTLVIAVVPAVFFLVFEFDPYVILHMEMAMLISAAAVRQWYDQFSAQRMLFPPLPEKDPYNDDTDPPDFGTPPEWIPICDTKTHTEAELLCHQLRRGGIKALSYSTRAVSLTGTLAPWEVSEPHLPFVTIYRGLAGGRLQIFAQEDDVERSARLLHSLETDR